MGIDVLTKGRRGRKTSLDLDVDVRRDNYGFGPYGHEGYGYDHGLDHGYGGHDAAYWGAHELNHDFGPHYAGYYGAHDYPLHGMGALHDQHHDAHFEGFHGDHYDAPHHLDAPHFEGFYGDHHD